MLRHPTTRTVVLLPGLLCDAAVWAPQADALAGERCVIADYGLLDSLPAMAEQVLGSVEGDGLCVVGHSMGGRVALEMARQAPRRVARLALLDTGMHARPSHTVGDVERRQRLELLQIARQRGMREMGRQWARGMVHPSRLGTPLFEEILDMIERKTPAIFEAQITALLARPDAEPVLASLQCPTLLACGRQDEWSPFSRHEQMHALLPASRLVAIEDSGHMTTMERPAAVNQALREWLNG